jgi:hypothetical protein
MQQYSNGRDAEHKTGGGGGGGGEASVTVATAEAAAPAATQGNNAGTREPSI